MCLLVLIVKQSTSGKYESFVEDNMEIGFPQISVNSQPVIDYLSAIMISAYNILVSTISTVPCCT